MNKAQEILSSFENISENFKEGREEDENIQNKDIKEGEKIENAEDERNGENIEDQTVEDENVENVENIENEEDGVNENAENEENIENDEDAIYENIQSIENIINEKKQFVKKEPENFNGNILAVFNIWFPETKLRGYQKIEQAQEITSEELKTMIIHIVNRMNRQDQIKLKDYIKEIIEEEVIKKMDKGIYIGGFGPESFTSKFQLNKISYYSELLFDPYSLSNKAFTAIDILDDLIIAGSEVQSKSEVLLYKKGEFRKLVSFSCKIFF